MRRYTFYLSIALLAFELGSFVSFKFYWNIQNDSPQVEPPEKSKTEVVNISPENKKTKQPTFIKIAFKDLSCKDEGLKPIWSELIDRTVSINTDYIERIKDCSDLIETNDSDGLNKDGQVDLDNDGQKEMFVRSVIGYFCGNNCRIFWVFRKDNEKGYRKLFEAMGYMTIVENKKTKGFKDIRFEVYANYAYIDQKLYRFNGTEYVPKKCWSESKLYKNKVGEILEGKKYKTTYHDCKETEWIRWN